LPEGFAAEKVRKGLALVVGRAAGNDQSVLDDGLKRIVPPEGKRIDRLDIVVPVN
jgi:hypothetical protein